ncbi:hypothetical protein [Priestia filamentosa]|uniref:hypothetical protein n=1 Tax=Priestia filamentosa TaxID=1402861 RepID=UPI0002ED3F5C|nr:hypothetical protein [Priestia filamentosa]
MALFEEQPIQPHGSKTKKETTSFQEAPFFLDEKKVKTRKRSFLHPFAALREKRAKAKKEKPPQIKKLITEIMPIVDYIENGLFQLKGEGFFDIWQIQSKDIFAMNEKEASFHIYNLANSFQSYQEAFKFVSLNLPVSTEQQQQYLEKKLERPQNPLYERFLQQKLKELQFLEWGRTNREYFIFIYGKTELMVKERREDLIRYFQRTNPLLEVSDKKKIELIYKLYNQNAKLGNKQ